MIPISLKDKKNLLLARLSLRTGMSFRCEFDLRPNVQSLSLLGTTGGISVLLWVILRVSVVKKIDHGVPKERTEIHRVSLK